jgi:hypothetical protein
MRNKNVAHGFRLLRNPQLSIPHEKSSSLSCLDCHAGRVGETDTAGIAVIATLPLYAAGNYSSRLTM